MKRRAAIWIIVLSSLMLLILPQAVFADSSWCWLTDTRPFDILPSVALATIVIEVLAIWLIPHTTNTDNTMIELFKFKSHWRYINFPKGKDGRRKQIHDETDVSVVVRIS